MTVYDPRITPARPDLAAKRLEGKVEAERFVDGEARDVIEPQAPLRRTPSLDAPLDTEALRGERFTVYDEDGEGWCWGQLEADCYVGWLPAQALAPAGPAPTHRVSALRALAYPGRSIKQAPMAALPFGGHVAVARVDQGFAMLPSGECIPVQHLAAIGALEPDFVAVAERFVATPYLWGGKTNLGIDCSGLVQVALAAAGIACPRDSDMQERALGEPVEGLLAWANEALSGSSGPAASRPSTPSPLARGDLIFWRGHVAIMRDPETIVHANAHHMAVAIEPALDAIRRIAATGSAVTSVRRLSGL